jgi:hypothetical protein
MMVLCNTQNIKKDVEKYKGVENDFYSNDSLNDNLEYLEMLIMDSRIDSLECAF